MAVNKKGRPAKKAIAKKVDKKETVVIPVEEEVQIEEDALNATDEIEDIKDTQEEKHSWDDHKVYEAKVDFVEQDPPLEKELEVMNGDPTVVAPKEDKILKIQMEALTATFKENKINKRVDNSIGYSWNGMEMDTY